MPKRIKTGTRANARKSKAIRTPLSARVRAERTIPQSIHVSGCNVDMQEWISEIETALRRAQADAYTHAAQIAGRKRSPREIFDQNTATSIAIELRGVAARLKRAAKTQAA